MPTCRKDGFYSDSGIPSSVRTPGLWTWLTVSREGQIPLCCINQLMDTIYSNSHIISFQLPLTARNRRNWLSYPVRQPAAAVRKTLFVVLDLRLAAVFASLLGLLIAAVPAPWQGCLSTVT